MDFSMRCWKNVVSALLCAALVCGCAGGAAQLRVRNAQLANGVLTAQLQWQPNDTVLDALDHGIALEFLLRVRAYGPARLGWHSTLARADRHIELRYFPLSRYYQLLDLDRHQSRGFPARASALAAFEDIRIPLSTWNAAEADRYRLDVAIDRKTLPGVLRMSSLVRPAWWLHSDAYTWPAGN